MKKSLIALWIVVFAIFGLGFIEVKAADSLQSQIDAAEEGSTLEITEDYTENITINKSVTLIGNGENTINGTCEINGGVNVTIRDLAFNVVTDNYLMKILGENNIVGLENVAITSSGNGVLIDDTALSTTLTIDGTTIISQKATDGRALGVRGAGSVVRIVNGSALSTTGGTGAATVHVNVLAPTNAAQIAIIDSSVTSDNCYAYFAWQGEVAANIENSEIKGFAAIYLKTASTNTITINSSQIIGMTKYSGDSNRFAAIVLESSGNRITAGGGTVITNEFLDGAESEEKLVLFSSVGNPVDNEIQLNDVLLKNTDNEANSDFIGYNTEANTIQITDETVFVGEDDEVVAVTREPDGTFVNAYSSFDDALAAAQEDDLVLQLAQGTYQRENGQVFEVGEETYLALSEEVKEAAAEAFPNIVLAEVTDDDVIIKANAIALKGGDVILKVKHKKQLEVMFDPASTTDQSVVWEIADEEIATVSEAGVLTAKKAGKTTLTITSNGISETYHVDVSRSWTPIIIVAAVILLVLFILSKIFWWL